ncbi:MAG: phosphosulfolactate synthase [Bacteroidota bacterium]|nr:phosphosulfolactate synthase [Bacteroidota bacterium]
MNFNLPYLPERTIKPRAYGINMVMDKGLSLKEAENLVSVSSDITDFIKLGFGTSIITKDLEKKIEIYKSANINVYLGGTLFEAYIVRNMFEDYLRLLDRLKIEVAEVSDGSIIMDHDVKCEYINKISKNRLVLSEVGSKEAGILISSGKWISMMQKELQAGSYKVIAEARESGNVGIYRPSGKAHVSLVDKIRSKVDNENIIWEAPLKSQQVWFIKLIGANVNLGNIPPNEVIPLETLRLGLRGDTFFNFVPSELLIHKQKINK